ncbi:MAG: division/cell wall cluster transcriptional repressor MraZ [Actinobacteria bacterium]|nr:division/cell wall cluster transcriptional repressor MraZ [Actinomycetota bacterium]
MFLGDHRHTLDAKGRVSLPSRFRSEMTGKLVVAKGLDKCLYVYPAGEYGRFVEELVAKEDFEPRLRKIRRFFTAGAVEVELDSAGRIGLPGNLRAYAGLSKDVAIAGNGNRIEIWDSAMWDEYSEAGENIEDLAKELSEAGML